MSGIYQRQINSGSVASPSAGRTLISVNESGELFTKDSSGNVSITQPKFVTIETQHNLDVDTLLGAVLADPFDIEQWKSSYTVAIPVESTVNGLYSTSGNFSSEDSFANIIAIDSGGNTFFAAANFFPEDSGGVLGSLQSINNAKLAGSFNGEWTYSYEEDASATGSDPKYLHDFRITIDSSQILGYVLIYADDSEFHNFIIDSAAG